MEADWPPSRARIEDAIVFGDGRILILDGGPERGFRVIRETTLGAVSDSLLDGWCDLASIADADADGILVTVGETSWEGEGFVAVADSKEGRLLWVLHLTSSEPFERVKVEKRVIRCFSGGYPDQYEWTIPVDEPSALSVERVDL